MDSEHIREVLHNIFRTELRERVPQIERLGRLDGLKDLDFLGVNCNLDTALVASYKAIGTDECYDDVYGLLLSNGVFDRSQAISSGTMNQGKQDECKYVCFALGNSNVMQASLRVYPSRHVF